MSYAAKEASTQDGSPVYKFLFVTGTQEYRYTTAPYFITDSNGTWEPVALTASNVTKTNEIAKNGIDVELPRDNPLALLFVGKVPEQATTLTVFRNHRPEDADDGRTYWKGRVVTAEATADRVSLKCEDVFTSMRRSGNRARYQKGCRHALYSAQCGVQQYEYAEAVTITTTDGFTVTVNQTDSVSDSNVDSNTGQIEGGQYYSGGIIELADGTTRYIIQQQGNTLTLISPFENIDLDSVAIEATLYPGCAHNVADCQDKFSNFVNYGGFPFLPGKNPFASSVNGSIL